jgi:hypothetical protein
VSEQSWRWQRVGDPAAPGEMLAAPAAGELRDAGVTVTAYECALPRRSPCPVCGQARVRWVASMTLPAPAHLPLPLGRGCTPSHAVVSAPTSWAGVAERLAQDGEHHRAALASGDERASERLAHLLPRQAEACAFLAAAAPEVRQQALTLWHEHPDRPVAEVAAATAGVRPDDRQEPS